MTGEQTPQEEVPTVSVHEYMDVRLKAADEHFKRLLERGLEKVRDETHDTRAWILLLTAASWGGLAADKQKSALVASIVTLGLMVAAGTYLLVRRRLAHKRRTSNAVEDEAFDDDEAESVRRVRLALWKNPIEIEIRHLKDEERPE